MLHIEPARRTVVLVPGAPYRRRMRIGLVAVAVLALTTSFAAPRPAEACSPGECSAWKEFTPAFGATIPAAGVLVFEYTFGEYTDPPDAALPGLTLTVEDDGGVAVAGTLALGPAPNTLVWRPDAPLSPGTSYSLEIVADNTVFADAWCADATVTAQAEFAADDLGLPVAAAPPLEVVFASEVMEEHELAALVCCDGAIPYVGGCTGPPWDEGFCASTKGWGWLAATVTLDAAAWSDARGQLGYIGFDFGATVSERRSPQSFCVTPEVIDFVTGEKVQGPMLCPDAGVEAELGARPLDPAAALAAACVGDPYTCVVDGGSWDESMCQPWGVDDSATDTSPTEGASETSPTSSDTGETDTAETDTADETVTAGENSEKSGCACATAPPSSALGLLVLVALLRRRRPGRHRPS